MGDTSGAPLKPLRDDSALRTLSSLGGLRGAPEAPPIMPRDAVSRTAHVGTVGKNGLIIGSFRDISTRNTNAMLRQLLLGQFLWEESVAM